MSNGITKDDLLAIMKEVHKEDMGHNNFYNVPPTGEVTKAINNPLMWISGYTVLLGFLGVLVYSIYSNDRESQAGKIIENTNTIKEISVSQDKTNDLIIKMQGNQERIAKQIEKNGDVLDNIREHNADVKTTRFTDKEGDELKDDLREFVRDFREEFLKEITETQGEVRTLDQKLDKDEEDLTLMKSRLQRVEDELDDLSPFMEDIKDRIKTLEMDQRRPRK